MNLPPQSRRVYFLGAGASRAFHTFPLASELTLEYLLNQSNYDDNAPRLAMKQLNAFLRSQADSAPIKSISFEKALGTFRIGDHPYYPYENAVICLARRLSLENRTLSVSILEDWLQDVRTRGDSVLTTNYDTVIEDVLAHLGTGEHAVGVMDAVDRDALHWLDYGVSSKFSYIPSDWRRWQTKPERSVLCLKLHGSISWLFCESCRKYILDTMLQYATENAITKHGDCPACKRRTERRPVLIPPVEEKQYGDAAIQSIWRRARKVLRSSEEVIFAGFSLNPVDGGIRSLLSEAFKASTTRKITIVDPKATELAPRYSEIYRGIQVDVINVSWKDYLQATFDGVRMISTPNLSPEPSLHL
jgi:hypothetical protein